MIGGQRNGDHRARPDGAVNNPWPRHGLTNADDRHLRRIDDSVQRFDSAFAEARNSDGRIGHLRTADAAGARALNEVAHVAHKIVKGSVSYTHLRAHETRHDLVCRLLLEKKKKN